MLKPITVLQIIQTIILKINQESDYQVRPISFCFLIIQKSVKNRTKNSFKKSTFTTLRATHFKSFFRKFEVILHFYLPSCIQTAKKSYFFLKKAVVCPPVYHTR